jgi:hypothetical protein
VQVVFRHLRRDGERSIDRAERILRSPDQHLGLRKEAEHHDILGVPHDSFADKFEGYVKSLGPQQKLSGMHGIAAIVRRQRQGLQSEGDGILVLIEGEFGGRPVPQWRGFARLDAGGAREIVGCLLEEPSRLQQTAGMHREFKGTRVVIAGRPRMNDRAIHLPGGSKGTAGVTMPLDPAGAKFQ